MDAFREVRASLLADFALVNMGINEILVRDNVVAQVEQASVNASSAPVSLLSPELVVLDEAVARTGRIDPGANPHRRSPGPPRRGLLFIA